MAGMVPGSLRRSQRVGPSNHGTGPNSIMVELRNSRQLHILHLNPRPRDPRFQQEMALYLQYRKSGPGVVSGPLTMPRRQVQPKQQTSHTSTDPTELHHPLSVTSERKPSDEPSELGSKNLKSQSQPGVANHTPDVDRVTVYDGPSNASSLMSSPAHTTPAANTRSASSVLVALHNQGRLSHATTTLPQLPDGDNAELKLSLSSKIEGLTREDKQGPLSPETQNNDASTCLALFTPRVGHTSIEPDVISSPKSIHSLSETAASALCPEAAPDTDLVIFFIHGVGGSSEIWQGQTEYFAQLGYEVIAPDLIGHGLSSAPRDQRAYHFREIAADMEELFDTYCKRRNILVGHSYGASFATLLARTRARRVTRLVLVSGGCPTPLAPQPGVFTLPYCLLACIMPCLTRSFYKGAFNKKRNSAGLSAPQRFAFHIPTHVLQHTMNGQEWPDGDELYHNWLTCPTLLLYGDKDKLVTLHEEQEMLRAVFDCRLEVIREASHMVMMEASTQVNSLIYSFLLHPAQPTHVLTETHASTESKTNTNNASVENLQSTGRSRVNLQSPVRSKSRRSLRSARTPRSRPQRLLSKSLIV
ncbi:abhydrolase domain-containing protein 8 [Elysia marginata]|uniref:acylglycerol lipase n=1 Tax=Elysia marginata TaxID=1093978 RepID=A0AAV4FQH0_9GAST|nr:abhydrolase domain-containing protein 8 [Elysia marginata]